MTASKIHFINRIDRRNAGDWQCSPLLHYYPHFKAHSLMRHDIDFIDWREVGRNDLVIFGGSGMINVTQQFNTSINRVLDRCKTVIGWGIGFNTHGKQWYQGEEFEPIDLSRFTLIAIRDYGHPSGIEWLPCPSACAPDLRLTAKTQRRIGVIEHLNLPITGLPYDKLTNAAPFEDICEFIASSEVVVTNSYHVAFWSQLMQRKALVIDKFSTKFDWFKYPPEFIQSDSCEPLQAQIDSAADKARIYPGALEEAIELNDRFLVRVKAVIASRELPEATSYQEYYQLTRPNMWNSQSGLVDISRRVIDIEAGQARDQASAGIQQLHADVHHRIDREAGLLHERISERERILSAKLEDLRDVVERQSREISVIKEQLAECRNSVLPSGDRAPARSDATQIGPLALHSINPVESTADTDEAGQGRHDDHGNTSVGKF